MRIAKRVGIFIVLLIILTSIYQPAVADTVDSRWFPLTGHFVKGEFLKFYQNAPDPLILFGYPITDAFMDQTGHQTQYFQRARFDLLMTDKGPSVVLANLGWFLYDDKGVPVDFAQSGPTCRMFPETGKNVCYAFLQFYDAYQGEKYFGSPISGMEYRNDRVVQYFEKARLEYLKNLPDGHNIILTQLGRPAFDMIIGDAKIVNRQIDGFIPARNPIQSINARAFVRASLVTAGMKQTVFLIVRDQDLQPVQGVQASVTLGYPDGAKFSFRPVGVTGLDGILKVELTAPELAPRQVVNVEITAELQGLKANATTWFRVWY